jgi:hypothetical protein
MARKSWHLNRRTFLLGSGLALGVPYLECMASAQTAAQAGGQPAAQLPGRLFCVYFPFGVVNQGEDEYSWWPRGEGADYRFSRTHRALEPYRSDVTFFQGFDHQRVRVGGHNSADYFLTGTDTRRGGNSVSVDQVAAAHLGTGTRLPSLVMSSDGGVGSPGSSHTLSYNAAGRPVSAVASPADIFARLFGAVTPEIRRQMEVDRSALDTLMESARDLQRQLGAQDRRTMDEFLSSTRTLEQDVQRAQAYLDVGNANLNASDMALNTRAGGNDPGTYLRVMYDLVFHAFRTDNTRVATYQSGSMRPGLSPATRWPRLLGMGGDCHSLAHGAARNPQAKSRWDSYMVEQFANLVRKLKTTQEGDATLLDRTMLFYGSSNSTTHRNANYPLILAGGGRLGIKHGTYIKNRGSRPLADIFLTMLQALGAPARSFADSTGPLADLRA